MLNKDIKILMISFSNRGALLSKRIEEILDYKIDNYAFYKYASNNNLKSFDNIKELIKNNFNNYDYLIFVGALGIAVREISPYIKNKYVDPGVIVIDELGKFTIPILSGHIGLSNLFARALSKKLNNILVVTTATDLNNRFKVDEFAVINDLYIENPGLLKEISSTILNQDLPCIIDFKHDEIANGLYIDNKGELGIMISYHHNPVFNRTLKLIPKSLIIGIGCKKDTPVDKIREALNKVLNDNDLSIHAVKEIASIDLKKEEKGLIELSKELNVEFITYSKDELNKLDGIFSSSDFVLKTTGVDCVCERAAKIKSDRLLIKKTVYNSVTISIGIIDYQIKFNYEE